MWLLLMCIVEINGDRSFEDCTPVAKFKTEEKCLEEFSIYKGIEYRCYYDEEILGEGLLE